MSRNFVLAAGAICWGLVAIDALVHLVGGDAFVPTVMAVAGVGWVSLRRVQLRFRAATARN